ncbi:MAG: hypothetical protein FJ112_08355 [Deltaproteobacteria bacterium]|nr:hypothetical protein [Deltaproteobacteria bacterium]
MDTFTKNRIKKVINDHRKSYGQLPTLKDLKNQGFSKKEIEVGIKEMWLEQLYVNLTSGAVVKVIKVKE